MKKKQIKDIEIILVDDNSSDNSLTIIQEHMKKDLRIKQLITNTKQKIKVIKMRKKYLIIH